MAKVSQAKKTSGEKRREDSDNLAPRIRQLAKANHPWQIELRRYLHQRPELSNEEFETTKYLLSQARALRLRTETYGLPTGFVADLLDTKKNAPMVAIRTDIDALPITERNDIPFKSKTPGKMHACGHDMHMATVLGAVKILTELRNSFSGSVRFIFQPAEESPPGGARPLIASGALAKPKVSAILGLHVDPGVPVGKIGLRDGPTMASVYDFDLIVRGVTGHAARPHDTVDAIVTAAEIIDSLQKLSSREFNPLHPVALTFGTIHGGVARNVVADAVTISGTLRTLDTEDAKRGPQLIKRCVHGIATARGAKVDIVERGSYPPLVNDNFVNKVFATSYEQLYGPNKTVQTNQSLGGEDFACYAEKIPGAMFRLGVRNPSIGAVRSWHSDKFMVDESALENGAALLAHGAIHALLWASGQVAK